MYLKSILLMSMSLGIIAQAVNKMPKIDSTYSLEPYMMKLESELKPESAESTYVRVIVWNTKPTGEDLQHHFNKFDLIKVEEKQLEYGKFDVVEKSESTYERFFYAYFTEQQLTATIFVKVNFNSRKNPSLIEAFTTKVNSALAKYGLIDEDKVDSAEIHPNSSTISYGSIPAIFIGFVLSVMIYYYHSARFYNTIGRMFSMIGFHSKARSFYQRERQIYEEILTQNISHLASVHDKAGNLYFQKRNHLQALLSYKKELELRETLYLQSHQRSSAISETIDFLFSKINTYSQDRHTVQPKSNHLYPASLYHDIALIYFEMEDDPKAVQFCKYAVEIEQESSVLNHLYLKMYKHDLKNLQDENFDQCFLGLEAFENGNMKS
uniref:Tetratricopeptide repeat family-like protein n=1 Tax=Adineta vaga TaxID=104782 RepID=B3G4F5_ADIVA|nr:tetratricopeptide repeat family-like protein [Adineta vaga]